MLLTNVEAWIARTSTKTGELDWDGLRESVRLDLLANATIRVRYVRQPLSVLKIPPEGGTVFLSWGTTTVRSGETSSAVLEVALPFVLEYVLVGKPESLERLSVVDLTSGGRSLFASPGPFSAVVFDGEDSGLLLKSAVTRTGEELVLAVKNLSDREKSFVAVAVGKYFETYQEAVEWLSTKKV
jgi:hypothetical protein